MDSTVQEKAIAFPIDSRLLEIARSKVVSHAKRCGMALRQTFAKEGKALRRKAGVNSAFFPLNKLRLFIRFSQSVLIRWLLLGRLQNSPNGDCAWSGF